MDQSSQSPNIAPQQPAQPGINPPPMPEPVSSMPTTPADPAPVTTSPTPVTSPSQSSQTPSPAGQPQQKSSHTKMIIIVLVLLALIVAGVVGWQMYVSNESLKVNNAVVTPTPIVSPTIASPSPTLGPVESGDSQLDQQSSLIDSNMEKLDQDVLGVDRGLQDRQTDLSQ